MFSTRLKGGKAFAPKQKIRYFKKLLFKSKRIEKMQGKKIKPNDLIINNNLNRTKSVKYGFAPD